MNDIRWACAGLIALAWGLWMECVASGESLRLDSRDGLYSLVAHEVPLTDLLQRIEVIEGVAIRHFGDADRLINASFSNVTLDQMLARLRVSYALVYELDDTGKYRLGDAIMMRHGEAELPSEIRATVLRLIRDLRDDNVRGNAHSALDALISMGCEIIPLLEDALYVNDYQGRQLAAQILRGFRCLDYVPSDRLLEVTLELLGMNEYDRDEYWSLFSPTGAFEYLHALDEDAYARVRAPLIQNLSRANRPLRLLSAALLAERGESEWTASLVRILAPHLADNDIRTDGGVAAHALYKLGPSVLPYLQPYRQSSDQQQAELADLICKALETDEIPIFAPVVYAGYPINPLRKRQSPAAAVWRSERFPDDAGRYHHLREGRTTTRDYFGPAFDSGLADKHQSSPRPLIPASQVIISSTRPPDLDSITETVDWKLHTFPYTSRSGDTLRTVARDFAVLIFDLQRLNPDLPTNTDEAIEPRTTILIPPMR